MTTYRLFTRFGYIWYHCPITGDEKQTVFREISSSQYAAKAKEMAHVVHFEDYGMDKGLALAVKTFMAMDYNNQLHYVVGDDGSTITLKFS